jgi:hypothetical protein
MNPIETKRAIQAALAGQPLTAAASTQQFLFDSKGKSTR